MSGTKTTRNTEKILSLIDEALECEMKDCNLYSRDAIDTTTPTQQPCGDSSETD